MAATKVDVRPPSICKDQLSGSLCKTSSSMSGLNAISSPKLCVRHFKGFAGGTSSLSSMSPRFQRPDHMMYKAASFPQSEDLADFCHISSVRAADADKTLNGSCRVDGYWNGYKRNATPAFNPVFGLLGAFSFHPFSPLNGQSGLGKIGLVNLHQFNSPPPLLFPPHPLRPWAAGEDSLLVPTLSHFEVKCSPQLSGEGGGGAISRSKEREQLCQQHASVSVSESTSSGFEVTKLPSVKSTLASKKIPEEASGATTSCSNCCVKVACSDDEIQDSFTGIHDSLKKIHGCDEDVTGYEYCHRDFGDSGSDTVVGVQSTGQSASSEEPPSIESDSTLTEKATLKVDHLVIDGHCELRKLPSDESGFYETSSPCDVSPGPNGWWQQDCLGLRCVGDEEDEEDLEWDDEDCEGELSMFCRYILCDPLGLKK